MSLVQDIEYFEKSLLTLLSGKKINPNGRPLDDRQSRLYQLLTRLHAGHYVSMEPQCYIGIPEHKHLPKKMMGRTDIHPLPKTLYSAAMQLQSVCQQIGEDVAPFEVLGLNLQKRRSWNESRQFRLDENKIGVMVASDIVALWDAMNLIRQRMAEQYKDQAPLIIQNDFYLWDYILSPNNLNVEGKKKKLEKYGIYFSSGAPDTAKKLRDFPHPEKIKADEIHLEISPFSQITKPVYAFATTDIKKTNEKRVGLKQSGAAGVFRVIYDIIGRYQITPEEQYSYEGNAAEKMEALVQHIKVLGTDFVRQQFRLHGYKDLSQVLLMTNDGGLGHLVENEKGERFIDLFTEKFFPTSFHKMNQRQMQPAVELAYLMRAERGLDTAYHNLEKSLDEVIANSGGRFSKNDFRAYDTSVDMCVLLNTVLDAIDIGQSLALSDLGVVSVFSAERNKVTFSPRFANGVEESPKTNHFLIVPDTEQTRSQAPGWEVDAPHAQTFNLLQVAANTNVPKSEEAKPERNRRANLSVGLIATPAALFAKKASPDFEKLKNILRDQFRVVTKQGADYWSKFKEDRDRVFAQASEGVSNSAYFAGMRRLFDDCDIAYFGHQGFSGKDAVKQKIQQGFSFLDFIVRFQTFIPVKGFVNPEAVSDWMKLLRHKQDMGLVGQTTEELMTLVGGPEDAAKKIAAYVETNENHQITPTVGRFRSDGQRENGSCFTVTTYFSATNVNKQWVNEAGRLGYLMAVNGFSLKVGGGNDGLMKAVADGFQRGKKELLDKGYSYPNELILVQCLKTEEIEAKYAGGGIYRCHETIEAREADLQDCDLEVAGAGGAGTDKEILGSLYSRVSGLVDTAKKRLLLLNQKLHMRTGTKGVHDLYPDVFGKKFLEDMNVDIVLTPEEVLAQALEQRSLRGEENSIALQDLRESLKNMSLAREMKAAMSFRRRWFRPDAVYMGVEGQLPETGNSPEYLQCKVA